MRFSCHRVGLPRKVRENAVSNHQTTDRVRLADETRQLFVAHIADKRREPVGRWSPAITEVLTGKDIALVGFGAEAGAELSQTLLQVPLLAPCLKTLPGPQATGPFDALVLAIGGDRGAFQQCLAEVRHAAYDFLVEPWTGDEVVFRLYRLLSVGASMGTPPRSADLQNCVLITDDDPAVAPLVSTMLRKFGIPCFTARNGLEGLERTRELRPRVLVLDIDMPGLDGFGVLMSMKKDRQFQGTRILMLTARDQENDIMRGFGYGADDYVTKPFLPMEVAARVTRLLAA